MSKNVGDIIKELITADNYIKARIAVSDEFIEMVKCCMPFQYELIAEKEEAYQYIIGLKGERL